MIVPPEAYDAWLSAGKDEALGLLRPYDPTAMEAVAISTRVNNVRNDDPEVIEPLTAG